ncbi:hypothetical protein AVEN_79431-1 [Araneus ventricosus]|uniref:Uncharacterized protein n=1 Tax=Araneus ventricosus TaxID=182803 RepID=A0A4Y1ZQL2_ARAVE|nr:hypothetical protein AVEN_79431-1 [Araneus ventricosus]
MESGIAAREIWISIPTKFQQHLAPILKWDPDTRDLTRMGPGDEGPLSEIWVPLIFRSNFSSDGIPTTTSHLADFHRFLSLYPSRVPKYPALIYEVNGRLYEESAPIHMDRFGPDGSNFQPIHLSPHYWLLRSPPPPPPALKNWSLAPLRFPHSPTVLHFVVFAFVREPRSPSPGSYFSFMTQRIK